MYDNPFKVSLELYVSLHVLIVILKMFIVFFISTLRRKCGYMIFFLLRQFCFLCVALIGKKIIFIFVTKISTKYMIVLMLLM